MSENKIEPPLKIASTEELMAIAFAMEEEAVRRYGELARRMRAQGEDSLAALFEFLSSIEAKHADLVDSRSRALIGRSPDPARVRWKLPESFDEEAASSATLDPYRALSIAIRNEERAFAFFSYLAAEAASEKLRRLAEEFAKEELDHAARLRHERRKAWRENRRAGQPAWLRGARPGSLPELLSRAAALERSAATAHHGLAAAMRAGSQDSAAALFERTAVDEEALAGELEGRLGGAAESLVPPLDARSAVEGLRILEHAFEHYTDIAEHAADEPMLQEAQRLAEHALRRLAKVHGSLTNSLPRA